MRTRTLIARDRSQAAVAAGAGAARRIAQTEGRVRIATHDAALDVYEAIIETDDPR